MRELTGRPIEVAPGTTVNWFAVDMRGNVEGGYDPATQIGSYRSTEIT
jgi:hypothetical protein